MRRLGGPCGGCRILDDLSSEVFLTLQLCASNEPLFPNVKTLDLSPSGRSIPFIPLFLSPRTTRITIWFSPFDFPKVMVASMITSFPALCPNLQDVCLHSLPVDPMISTAVSAILLARNRKNLRCFLVDSPLTQEAHGVIYTLSNLRKLSVVMGRDTSLPSVVLPNLTDLSIAYRHDGDWLREFHGAMLGSLETVTFNSESDQIGDFLETFERVALTTSIHDTLSTFRLFTLCAWYPNRSSLHPFTQMAHLTIEFACDDLGCSSTVERCQSWKPSN